MIGDENIVRNVISMSSTETFDKQDGVLCRYCGKKMGNLSKYHFHLSKCREFVRKTDVTKEPNKSRETKHNVFDEWGNLT